MADLQRLIEAGDVVRLTVNGTPLHYRARRAAESLGDLTLADLQPDPASDANAAILRALAAMEGR